MLTITEELLKLFPTWKKAGWKVGDHINIVEWVAAHPPKKPGS